MIKKKKKWFRTCSTPLQSDGSNPSQGDDVPRPDWLLHEVEKRTHRLSEPPQNPNKPQYLRDGSSTRLCAIARIKVLSINVQLMTRGALSLLLPPLSPPQFLSLSSRRLSLLHPPPPLPATCKPTSLSLSLCVCACAIIYVYVLVVVLG